MENVDVAQETSWQNQMKGGAYWFYWIAALSFVNSLLVYFGVNWNFFLGLGVTQVITVQMSNSASSPIVILVVNLLVSALFAALGYFASQGKLWAFVIGLILYILDVFSLVLIQDYQNVNYLSVIFHIIAAFLIFRGLLACRRVQLEAAA